MKPDVAGRWRALLFNGKLCETPSFIIEERALSASLQQVRRMCDAAKCHLLFSLKACALYRSSQLVAESVDGFSCSSCFEATLARDVLRERGTLHVSTPGLTFDNMHCLVGRSNYISFNSIEQWRRFKQHAVGKLKCGLRINPGVSFIEDPRYNPCRAASKLGVPEDALTRSAEMEPGLLQSISGIHFHNNCDSADFSALLATVRHIDRRLGPLLQTMEWVNIGGGYLPSEAESVDPFYEAVGVLKDKYGLDVFFEPGAGIVRSAGLFVSTVIDLFESGGKRIAILDTTVNHMPEVFEYQFEPDVAGHTDDGRYHYVLGGCTCLAGDVFGEYAFDEPLEVSSRVIFINVGAYTTVKWHMFNGVNLPTIYALTEEGELVLKRRFTYEDFASRCGVETNALIGT